MNRFFAAGEPKPKGSMSTFYNKALGRSVIVGKPTVKRWEKAVALAAKMAWSEPLLTEAVRVRLVFYLPRGKTVKRPWPSVKYTGDLDKHMRSVLDALTGVVYVDDTQVCEATLSKRYADENEPGVLVEISECDASP
jgi:Holliday junction resolvase RusA-like endonuclease